MASWRAGQVETAERGSGAGLVLTLGLRCWDPMQACIWTDREEAIIQSIFSDTNGMSYKDLQRWQGSTHPGALRLRHCLLTTSSPGLCWWPPQLSEAGNFSIPFLCGLHLSS